MKKNMIKILGLAATVFGVGATLISDWVKDQKMNDTIEEKVNKALAERENEDNEES